MFMAAASGGSVCRCRGNEDILHVGCHNDRAVWDPGGSTLLKC